MAEKPGRAEAVVGWATLGGVVTGYVSLVMAFVVLVNGRAEAAAVCLGAAALAFGLVANAVLRH